MSFWMTRKTRGRKRFAGRAATTELNDFRGRKGCGGKERRMETTISERLGESCWPEYASGHPHWAQSKKSFIRERLALGGIIKHGLNETSSGLSSQCWRESSSSRCLGDRLDPGGADQERKRKSNSRSTSPNVSSKGRTCTNLNGGVSRRRLRAADRVLHESGEVGSGTRRRSQQQLIAAVRKFLT